MEYWNNILCCEARWLVESSVMTESNYRNLTQRHDINVVRRGCRGTSALVAYESMPERFKSRVKELVGDVYKAAGRNDIEPLIEHSAETADFFEHYKTADGKFLPEERRREYYANAVVMDAMGRFIRNRQAKRRALGGQAKRKVWEEMAQAAQELDRQKWPHSLPENARSLERKFKLYMSEGAESLVHNAYKADRKNALKVETEQQRSMMGMLISDPRNLDNEQVATFYNTMAKAMQWPTICASTVGTWRDKLDNVVYARRRGGNAYRNEKAMQVKRSAPETALTYWTMDGWDAELMYQRKDKSGTTYHHRLTMVVVLDTCCKYPVGYAIGDHETPELIKAALRDAARHTERLFGRMYKTVQLQSDNYAISKMTPLYAQVAQHVTPAERGNAKAKVIEPWFRYFNKKYCQTQWNWSGFGVTSRKDLQPNADFIAKHKHQFPTLDEAYAQLASMIEAERAELKARYIEMYEHTPDDRKIELSRMDYLRVFGERTGRKNLLQGSGLKVSIGGRTTTYDCFDPEFRKWASTRWTVLYDPDDRREALAVNDDMTLQFLLEEKHVQPMALADRTEGDYDQLVRVREFNAREEERIKREICSIQQTAEALVASAGGRKELETLHKLMISDSRGQHKNRRERARLITEGLPPRDDMERDDIDTDDKFYDIL